MKISLKRTSPNYRAKSSTTRIMNDLTLALLAVVAFVFYYYFGIDSEHGMKSVMIIVTACLTALITELVWFIGKHKNIGKAIEAIKYSYPLVTALIYALILPIGVPLYVVGVGAFMAIFFGKLIYGGFGQNIFNPAIVGRAIVGLSFGDKMLTYLGNAPKMLDATTGATPAALFNRNNWLLTGESTFNFGLNELFSGMYSAALGETCTYLLLAIAIFLVVRKVIDWRIPTFYVGTVVIIAAIVAVFQQMNPLEYALLHVGVGGLAFGAVFMATDPVTSPTSLDGKVIFGIMLGFITMLLRLKSNYPEGVYYSIILMNMVTPLIDDLSLGMTNKNITKKWVVIGCVASIALAITGGIGNSYLKPIITPPAIKEVTHNGGVVGGTIKLPGTITVTDVKTGDVIAEKVVAKAGNFEVAIKKELKADQILNVTLTLESGQTSDVTEVTVVQGVVAEVIGAVPGAYIVKTKGFNDNLIVKVSLDTVNQRVTNVEIVSHEETEEYGGYLFEGKTPDGGNADASSSFVSMMNNGVSFDAVGDIDAKTGATKSAEGIKSAIEAAIEELNSTTLDSVVGNVRTVTAHTGFYGDITVAVTVSGNNVTSEIIKEDETPEYGGNLLTGKTPDGGNAEISANFYDKFINGTTNINDLIDVDVKTGATITASAVRSAILRAIVG